jgi:phosphoenolpyruvate-protein kinase (PTS system EI component)
MVEEPAQVERVRAIFRAETDIEPLCGAMVESTAAVERLADIADVSDFLSIGTNDLTHSILATNRFAPGEAAAYHPRVLAAIAAVAQAASARGLSLEVCGEAASDPVAMPLLLGLGVDELSVGAARVGQVRRWVRSLEMARAKALAQSALQLDTAAAVAQLMRPVRELLGEGGDAVAEGVERRVGVVPVGGQA